MRTVNPVSFAIKEKRKKIKKLNGIRRNIIANKEFDYVEGMKCSVRKEGLEEHLQWPSGCASLSDIINMSTVG